MDYPLKSFDHLMKKLDFTNHDITDLEQWIGIGALIVSSICLTIHLIAFMILPELRKHSGKYLASLSVAFLVDYLFSVAAHFTTPGTLGCKCFGWILYYFSLVPYAWIAIISMVMWKNLRDATRMATVSVNLEKRCTRFVCSSLLAYLLPGFFLFVRIMIICQIDTTFFLVCFVPYMGFYACWLGHSCSSGVLYHGPVILFASLAILFLVLSGMTLFTGKSEDEATLAVVSKQIKLKPFAVVAIIAYVSIIVDLSEIFIDDFSIFYVSMLLKPILGICFVIGFTRTGKSHTVEMNDKDKTQGQPYDIEEVH